MPPVSKDALRSRSAGTASLEAERRRLLLPLFPLHPVLRIKQRRASRAPSIRVPLHRVRNQAPARTARVYSKAPRRFREERRSPDAKRLPGIRRKVQRSPGLRLPGESLFLREAFPRRMKRAPKRLAARSSATQSLTRYIE